MEERTKPRRLERSTRIAAAVIVSGSLLALGAAAGAAAADHRTPTGPPASMPMLGSMADLHAGSEMDAMHGPDAMAEMHASQIMERMHDRVPGCAQMHEQMGEMMAQNGGMMGDLGGSLHDAHHPET